jgi:AAHS family cis,cis-muconate transporter-like MFS transporter
MAVAMQRLVPEPPSWVENAAKRASRKEEKVVPIRGENQWTGIFSNPGHRRMFILWSLTAGFLQFGYYGVNNWLPTYIVSELKFNFTKMTSYLVGTYIAMILGKIIAGWLADKFGRRWIYAFGGLATAVFIPLIVMYHSPDNIVGMLTFFGFLYGVPYGVAATYMTESFETKIRGTAVGGAYNVGRVGAAIAPTVIGVIATEYSIGLGLIIMGGAYFFTGIIPALFIREKMYDPQQAV